MAKTSQLPPGEFEITVNPEFDRDSSPDGWFRRMPTGRLTTSVSNGLQRVTFEGHPAEILGQIRLLEEGMPTLKAMLQANLEAQREPSLPRCRPRAGRPIKALVGGEVVTLLYNPHFEAYVPEDKEVDDDE